MTTHDSSVELSVIIPLYNEESCIIENIGKTVSFLDALDMDYEIILVNDGSTDGTLSLCQGLAKNSSRIRLHGHKPNRGKGYSVASGMLAGTGKFRLFMDADLAVPLEYLIPFLEQLRKGAPIVIASRHAQGAAIQVRESATREFMGKVFRQMALKGLGLPVTDVTCGLKAFSQEACQAIFPLARIERWTYDAEILLLAAKLGYPIAEVPIIWFHNQDSAVRVGRDAAQSLVDLLRIGFWSLTGAYGLNARKSHE